MSFLNVGLDKNKLRTIYQAQAGITTLFWDDGHWRSRVRRTA